MFDFKQSIDSYTKFYMPLLLRLIHIPYTIALYSLLVYYCK